MVLSLRIIQGEFTHGIFEDLFLIYISFQTFWQHLATEFLSDSHVIFDMMNEPYGIPATDAASLMQAGVNGVRASGATQLILVEGTSWTGAWSEFLAPLRC